MKVIVKIITTAVASAVTAALAVKAICSKQTAKKVENAIFETSKAYEAKYTKLALEFAEQTEKLMKEVEVLQCETEKKNQLMNDCLTYINDLEQERDSLADENKMLNGEKQQLLAKLYAIKTKLSA